MSQAAASASLIGLPNFGTSAANAALAISANAPATLIVLHVDMADRPLGIDTPARNAIHMIHREGRDIGRVARLAAFGDELLARRLHITGLVGGAAHDHGRLAAPLPWHAETGQRLGQHRRLKRRQGPALATVGRDLDLCDTAMARIGDAGNLAIAGPRHGLAWRWPCDEGFDLFGIEEPPRFAGIEQHRVLARFVDRHD